MKLAQPVKRAGDQKALHLPAAKIIDVGVPIVMESLLGVGVLIERCAVEPRKAMAIGRKMPGNPVQDHPDIRAMAGVDEMRKFLRLAKTCRRRELGKRLIAPRAAKVMLHDGQEFDMGEAERTDIGNELLRKAAPIQNARGVALRTQP